MNCIDFTSKRSKMFSYVAKHSKLCKNKSDQNQSDVKTIQTFELGRKTTQVIILQWIASILHQNDLKCSVTSQNIQNYAKLQKWSNHNELHQSDVRTIKTFELRPSTTKVIKLQWITSIWHQINQKCWETSQNIQNNA